MSETQKATVVDRLRRDVTPETYRRIREEWKRHSIAEDNRDIAGLISTLTPDCMYELVQTGHRWRGHDGAQRFYTELLTAFPDIKFDLTDIVIGPQGVCQEASVTATHRAEWLGAAATGRPVAFKVVIFFPWDPAREKFTGEKIYLDDPAILRSS
jgi:predicted ester cyclase